MADSRPDPGPATNTSTSFIPFSKAIFAAFCDATCAAKGVDFLEPANPTEPQLDHTITFPPRSVIVTRVLLKVARICAMPSETFRTIFFLDLNFFALATWVAYPPLFFIFWVRPPLRVWPPRAPSSSARRSSSWGPSACGRSSVSFDRGRAGPSCAAFPGRSRYPSGA